MLCIILYVLVSMPVWISGSSVGLHRVSCAELRDLRSYSDVGECLNLLECSRRRFGGAEEDGGKNIFRNVGIHTDLYGDIFQKT